MALAGGGPPAQPPSIQQSAAAVLTLVMEPKRNPDYEFNSRAYRSPIYNGLVAPLLKRTMLLGGGLLLLFALILTTSLWLIPRPHRPLHYMVAGSVATAVALAGGFALMQWMPGNDRPVVRIRIARKSGQSS
jgi:hypothetical protein